ncbi:hypothetical protein [Microbacterium murale]|nr:hypothetical protein [Microbacterium murale]
MALRAHHPREGATPHELSPMESGLSIVKGIEVGGQGYKAMFDGQG